MSKEVAKNETGVVKIDYAAKIALFKEKTKEFDLDFVDLGTMLRLNAKGQFESKDNEEVVFNEMTVVILNGKPRFNLWGKDDSPQANELLFSCDSEEEAKNKFEEFCAEDAVNEQMYSWSDVSKRYIITFVSDDGQLYAIDMSATSKYAFGAYAKKLFNDHGVGPMEVVTKLGTETKKKDRNSWNVVTFEFLSKRDDV